MLSCIAVSIIKVHASLFRVASIPEVRYDLSWRLPIVHYVSGIYGYLYIHEPYVNLRFMKFAKYPGFLFVCFSCYLIYNSFRPKEIHYELSISFDAIIREVRFCSLVQNEPHSSQTAVHMKRNIHMHEWDVYTLLQII